MQFDAHINKLSMKLNGTIMYANRLEDNFNKISRITVIQSLVISIMNYDINIWEKTNATQVQRV